MHGTRFAQFSTEVLRRGAAAVLPQHLPDHWLDALLEEAELLAPEAWDPQEDERVQECCAGLLGAVLVVLMEQRGHPDQLEVAVSTLMRHLHCYMLALAAERVSRDTEIWLEPPTLANLFDEAREVQARRRAAEDSSTVSHRLWGMHRGHANAINTLRFAAFNRKTQYMQWVAYMYAPQPHWARLDARAVLVRRLR
jgi:hypothetical protein